MKASTFRALAWRSTLTHSASKPWWLASSPTQTSNRSPSNSTASAGVLNKWSRQASKVRGMSACRCTSDSKSMRCQLRSACQTSASA